MKNINFTLLFVFLGLTNSLFGQLTEEKLQAAITGSYCEKISSELDTLSLTSIRMKFNAAVCFYRNGNLDRALELFKEVHAAKDQRWKMAAFWEVKIYARQQKDSAAIAGLQNIPAGFLTEKMLSQKEFEDLANTSEAFAQLKQSLKPAFNIWTGALSLIAVIGFLVGFMLLFGRSRFSAGEKWLALLVFSFTIILCAYITIWTGYVASFPYLRSTWPFLTLLVGPSLYFYLKDTFKEDYNLKDVIHHFCIPFISFLCLLPAVLNDFGMQLQFPQDIISIGSSSIVLTCHILFYTVRIHYMTQNEWQVDANIKTWTGILSWGMKVYTLAFLSYFVLVSSSFFNPEWDYAISMVMTFGILLIAYMGLLQKRVFSSEPIEHILSVQKYQSSSLTPGASEAIKKRLERLLTEEQVFKENELRLDDLASYLDISRHQLSQVINEHYKVNFFELLNTYRVAYVKKVLTDPSYAQYTIIQIAYEAGFNNKASFNRYFKREMGITPSAYRIKEEIGDRK